MAASSQRIIEEFDFTEALRLPVDKRLRACVSRAKRRLVAQDLLDLFMIPPIPSGGASEAELDDLRRTLGVPLPEEYASFLRRWRYLTLDDGFQVWGFDHEGVTIGSPWVSDGHVAGRRHLVFADYGRYADGDQLLFDLDDPAVPVVAYLHEWPRVEPYAPSFSLALWRMVHERLEDDQEQ